MRRLDDIFSLKFTAECYRKNIPAWLKPKVRLASHDAQYEALRKEFETQRFSEIHWRISSANKEFQ